MVDVTEIFVHVDDFYLSCQGKFSSRVLPKLCRGRKRGPRPKLSMSEVMTIQILFHMSKVKTFKDFYTNQVWNLMRNEFPQLVSYNRFTELASESCLMLYAYVISKQGTCTGTSFIDSTPLRVCRVKRERQHKVFDGLASKGKTTMGWFYGFKLHVIINHLGEILSFCLTEGKSHDLSVLEEMSNGLHGYLVGDKGYISKEKRKKLHREGIRLVTKVRKNMKPIERSEEEEILLKKRGLIETVFGVLKAETEVDHSRHRSPKNFVSNLLSALAAYCLRSRKPALRPLDLTNSLTVDL